ncbi:MAG: hypothetical protein ABWZ25_09000 [Chitinophagaceae bacterium]
MANLIGHSGFHLIYILSSHTSEGWMGQFRFKPGVGVKKNNVSVSLKNLNYKLKLFYLSNLISTYETTNATNALLTYYNLFFSHQ